MITTIGGLMDGARVDYRHEVSGDVMVTWYFGRTFREMAAESNHWAILDRQAVFHLGSKYSVLLFQYIASLQNSSTSPASGLLFPICERCLACLMGNSQGLLT